MDMLPASLRIGSLSPETAQDPALAAAGARDEIAIKPAAAIAFAPDGGRSIIVPVDGLTRRVRIDEK